MQSQGTLQLSNHIAVAALAWKLGTLKRHGCLLQGDEDHSPAQLVQWRNWDGLLLLAGLIHQSTPAVKQQLLHERGSLLLQLLYVVLLEDPGLGGKGVPVQQKLLLSCKEAALEAVCKGGTMGCLDSDKVNSMLEDSHIGELNPARLVLLVLQGLLCTVGANEQSQAAEGKGAVAGVWVLTTAGEPCFARVHTKRA